MSAAAFGSVEINYLDERDPRLMASHAFSKAPQWLELDRSSTSDITVKSISSIASMASMRSEFAQNPRAPLPAYRRSTEPTSRTIYSAGVSGDETEAEAQPPPIPRKPVHHTWRAEEVAGVPVAFPDHGFEDRLRAAAGRYQERSRSALADRRDMRRASLRLASGGYDRLF